MCDEDVRMLMRENVCDNNTHVTYLSGSEEVSEHFIKSVLTFSKNTVI